MRKENDKGKKEALENFCFSGSGHINDTYLLVFEEPGQGTNKKILQHMNRQIFTRPVELMENIMNVTTYLRKRIIEKGGDPDRETLNLVPALDGKAYFIDSEGEYWRAYQFITGASCYDQVEKPEDFYQSAYSFGNFQRMLADYPAESLHETIEGFHPRISRYKVKVCGISARCGGGCLQKGGIGETGDRLCVCTRGHHRGARGDAGKERDATAGDPQ